MPIFATKRGSTGKLEDPAKERNRLCGKARAERESEQEAQGKRARENAERRLSHEQEAKERRLKIIEGKEFFWKKGASRRAERELRAHERDDKAATEQKYQQNLSKDHTPLMLPMTDPIKELQLSWTECQKPTTVPPASFIKADKSFGDTIDTNTKSQSPKCAPVSTEFSHSPTSSSKIREDISKDIEVKIYP